MKFAVLLLLLGCGDAASSADGGNRRVIFAPTGGSAVALADAGRELELEGADAGRELAQDAGTIDARAPEDAQVDGGCLGDVGQRCADLPAPNSLSCETCGGVKQCVCGPSVNAPGVCVFTCG